MVGPQDITYWLLEGDPALRWQVMRDLLRTEEATWAAERDRLTTGGWCAELLQRQAEDGLWNRSLYNGKWISTTYTLYLLKLFGLPHHHPQALKGCEQLLRRGLYRQQEIRFSRNQGIRDVGVTALVLSLCCYFGLEDDSLVRVADWLVEQQAETGEWRSDESSSPSTYRFETTLLALEALLQCGRRYPADDGNALSAAVANGQEFLLRHRLYLDLGKPIKAQWTSFSFPPYWFYDVLTALDYFRGFGRNRDVRLRHAVDLLLRRRRADGTWALGARHPGRTHFDMERPGGPSRWNTLRALRVLEWWGEPNQSEPAQAGPRAKGPT